ncbi:SMP-30/gluconolactonase/LRE family protein [Azospirillum formosense]|uniref:SMP-30/gluconolactonase/LRE family protein n=1 Tax=Azospirillum formosense TaxID=861533 RepID=A0ABX2L3G7_9PROT|nr:SMP-30/gluconolactonase/LRE family protein [Azospirillum formosense]MBY3756779.1 SMP-30/gluconolactonase/LRE family protein [Azospirillum formosense]NUB21689.1 SMP-30/gluconolactonase/LRE family protein [Azospirillum formosense]
MDAHCVWEAGAQLGEGPVWSPSRNALFAVDIRGSRLLRYTPADGQGRDWPLEEAACWLVERADGAGFIAGLRSRRLVGLTLDGDRLSVGAELMRLEEDTPGNRLNDAMADAAGRLWVGSMDDAEEDASGALYRIGPDGSVERADEGYTVSNGPALSPDGRTLYHTDSPRRTIYAFALAADGTLSGKRVHLRFGEEDGYPDGMTCDAEGHLWVAHWSGGRVSRFRPDGTLDQVVRLPVSNVTSCAFGGPGLDRLFITTAAATTQDAPAGEPLAGGLFTCTPGVVGLPPGRFGAP